ncbi:MAG TPA: Crp/Fnr family transcriptional regulator [Alphaproteobacteria bacterium]|nr:Crp/Fnr family transcriptional regulator [Alphaproteobacteria bacterium]
MNDDPPAAPETAPEATKSWLRIDWFPAGHVLVPQGGKLGKLFVLRQGEVEIERNGTFINSTSQPGAIFGEMSLLLDIPHSATVRAVTDIEVFVIEDALRVLEANPGWTLQIARLLAQRVDATTRLLAESQQQEVADGQRLVLPQNVFAQWADPQV